MKNKHLIKNVRKHEGNDGEDDKYNEERIVNILKHII